MPIIRSIPKVIKAPPPEPEKPSALFKEIFGDISVPPLLDGHWPSGSAHMCRHVPKFMGRNVVLGWSVRTPFRPAKLVRVFVATKIGHFKDREWHGIDPLKDFKYLCECAHQQAGEMLADAFEEIHELVIAFPREAARSRS